MNRVFIDVREPNEYAKAHINGALNIPPAELINGTPKLKEIPKDAEIILYCVSGSRSRVSMNLLRQMGFTNLTNGINIDHVSKTYNL